MSSKNNDTNNTIHLGNYEEFFILYMDNELTPEQMNMVDAFLVLHPDLRGEFEMLMSTRLPREEFSIIKDELYADNMQSSSVGEDLLSYIDNELDAEKAKILELELAANSAYRLQHDVLLKTKLDPSENITYPKKEELYRRTERVIAFKPWMRVAAAVLIISVSGIAYFNSSVDKQQTKPFVATNNTQKKQTSVEATKPVAESNIALANNATNSDGQTNHRTLVRQTTKASIELAKNSVQQPVLRNNQEEQNKEMAYVDPVTVNHGDRTVVNGVVETNVGVQQVVNNSVVTSNASFRNTINAAATDPDMKDVVADRKQGSVKGFLRKATRLIEKRTGIDPTNDNGELLLGAVAVKLK